MTKLFLMVVVHWWWSLWLWLCQSDWEGSLYPISPSYQHWPKFFLSSEITSYLNTFGRWMYLPKVHCTLFLNAQLWQFYCWLQNFLNQFGWELGQSLSQFPIFSLHHKAANLVQFQGDQTGRKDAKHSFISFYIADMTEFFFVFFLQKIKDSLANG